MPQRHRVPHRMGATLALSAWTLLVWTTRINNIWTDDDLDAAARAGSTALALSFTVLAVAVLAALWFRRRQQVGWLRPLVAALAAWTVVVWVARGVQIALADHSAAFVAVHLALAVVSIALAVLALRDVAAARRTGDSDGQEALAGPRQR
jgi:hypothetical protein